jgi:S-adenosylmethionine hydrolase
VLSPGTTAVSGFGSKCTSPNTFPLQTAVVKGDSILGQILFTDNFGNCITNIPDHLISQIPVGTILTLKSDTVQLNIELGVTYASVPVGENVCFINSSNFLELAVDYGDFSDKYKLGAGSLIKLIK